MAEAADRREVFIHPTSVVDAGASIGPGTKIWHFCHVYAGARIGRDCCLGQGGMVAGGAVVGDGCRIQNGVSVYDGVTLEDGVFCGPHMVFTNVRRPRAFLDRSSEFEPTRVRRGATLGAGCVLLPGVTVGRFALVGAGAVVTRDVPDFAEVRGTPARPAGWVGRDGLPLAFDDAGRAVDAAGARYRLSEGRVACEGEKA
jgi:UDP-2-acetamido-3-amino-2,3-dideoxy-glucuronate N-acetyltransferase